MDKERVYISNQLACMLPPTALKTLFYLISWQSQEQIKYYQKQFAKTMHLDQAEIEQAIQLLIDKELISASRIDNNWVFVLEKKKIQSYFNVPMNKVVEHDGFKLPTQITWNKEEKKQSNVINDMSDDEMKRMILMLQARLNEKEQVKKVVVSASKNETEDVIDNLPF